MRAAAVAEYGGSEVISVIDQPLPEPAPDSLRLTVKAAGVNPVDIAIRSGYLRDYMTPTFPFVLGLDLAGVVDAVGADVTEFSPGDEVVGSLLSEGLAAGAFTEYLTAHPRCFVAKPAGVTFRQGAAIPHAALTASQALEALKVGDGDVVLIHAAAGGVGSFAVQLAVRAGARVIGTAGVANHRYLRDLGAEPVAYQQDLVEQLRELAPDGFDVVLDLIGGDELRQSIPLLRSGGRLGSAVDFGVGELGGQLIAGHPDRERLAELVNLVGTGDLTVQVSGSYPLSDVSTALDRVAARHVRGKVVIDIGD